MTAGREMIVKVCGITRVSDARRSIEWGANALGFNFYRGSPRRIGVNKAQDILQTLPDSVLRVAVVVVGPGRHPPELPSGIDVVQVHGARSEEDLAPFAGHRLWLAVKGDRLDLWPGREIIVDPSRGRGVQADWRELAGARRPFVLAGGLDADNVVEALETVDPAGVDVCSGVEAQPGRKDPAKLEQFLGAVRHWCR